MKKLICSLAAASFMLSGCTLIYWNEREYIIENGPRWAWEISIAKATKAECERLVEVITDYENEEIQDYDTIGQQEDLDSYKALSLFGLDYFYSGNEAERNRAIKRYKDRYQEAVPVLIAYMAEMAENPALLGEADGPLDDNTICKRLLGTPAKISNESDEELKEMARKIIIGIRDERSMPVVESCKYDRSIKQWDAILSSGSHLYVMVVRGHKEYKRFFYSLGQPYTAPEE